MNKSLARTIACIAFGISLLSLAIITTPSIVSKAYAQNSSGNALTKVNKTGGLTASPKEAVTSGLATAKNASSSPSKFMGGAPLNQSGSNSTK
ncbi:MAG TPA: hypothetical protein VH500_05650 [Nitrososphaeraceae archaeon]|jgi:hypothetical protein